MIEIAVNNLAAATGARFLSPFPVKTSTAMILLPVPSSRVPAPS